MIYKPLEEYRTTTKPKVFLAGSIEMGKAENWQERIGKRFSDAGCVVFNPRRDDWDSNAEQSFHNDYFRNQVKWEIKMISASDLVFFYIDPNTKSPITLFELGLCSRIHPNKSEKDIIVVCEDGFYRYGNLDVYSKSFQMYPMVDTEDKAFTYIKHNYYLFKDMNF